jgi:hypothetical protein
MFLYICIEVQFRFLSFSILYKSFIAFFLLEVFVFPRCRRRSGGLIQLAPCQAHGEVGVSPESMLKEQRNDADRILMSATDRNCKWFILQVKELPTCLVLINIVHDTVISYRTENKLFLFYFLFLATVSFPGPLPCNVSTSNERVHTIAKDWHQGRCPWHWPSGIGHRFL